MKKQLFFICILLIFTSRISTAQKKAKHNMPYYPAYEEVIEKFLINYSPDLDEKQPVFALAKMPDGWHARTLSYPQNQPVKDELFWSRKEKKYLELSFNKNNTGKIDSAYEYLKRNISAETFSTLVPYWGYDGWEKDVISEFSNKSNLSDTLLNGLARSYSSYARSMVSNPEFGNPQKYEQLPKGQNALNSTILNDYLNNQHLAIETYYKLYKQNPGFETFVSSIFNVYSNEILNGYLSLRYLQNEETARKELKPGLYDDFYIEMAKNYLNSCDSNAILFVNGDMDTYPLLYVQEMENFRKDVLVVNVSLLNLGRYINHLANFRGGAKPLETGMDSAIYKSESKQIVYVYEVTEESKSISEILDFVVSENPENKLKMSEGQLIDYIPTRNLYFKIDKEKIKNEFGKETDKIDSAIYIRLNKNYLTIAEFCILDIVATNNFKRPIYFAITVASDNFLGLDEYLRLDAMAYKLTPLKKAKADEFTTGYIKTDVLYNKCFEKLSFDKKNYQKKELCRNQKQMINTYRNMFGRLSTQSLEENKPEVSLSVMEKCIDLFPADFAPYNYNVLDFIKNYFKIGQNAKAKNLVDKYMKSIISEIELLVKTNNNSKNEQEIRVQVYLLDELVRVSDEFIPDDALTAQLKQAFKKYESYYYY